MGRIRQWPFVSFNIHPSHLREWTELAREKGYSRADLLREALERVGLPYARAVAKKQQSTDDEQSAGTWALPRAPC